VNAGHDLDLRNLTVFHALPYLDEVSIGHALISHALFVGFIRGGRDYLAALEGRHGDRRALRQASRGLALGA
jgi:pyridoxine 5-phosphate synthase